MGGDSVWFQAAVMLALALPSSATMERAFSHFPILFNDRKDRTLADVIRFTLQGNINGRFI